MIYCWAVVCQNLVQERAGNAQSIAGPDPLGIVFWGGACGGAIVVRGVRKLSHSCKLVCHIERERETVRTMGHPRKHPSLLQRPKMAGPRSSTRNAEKIPPSRSEIMEPFQPRDTTPEIPPNIPENSSETLVLCGFLLRVQKYHSALVVEIHCPAISGLCNRSGRSLAHFA